MRMRRGSLLSGTTFGSAIQQYKPGDVVKSILVDDHYFSGVVRDVDTKTNKITVAWGGGPVSQHDVDEIMPGPGDVNYGAGVTKEIVIKASSNRRMRSGLGDVIDVHKDDCNCSLCDVMSTSGDEPPAQQPAWVLQDGPQESAIISSDLRRGRFSADPSLDNFKGKPGTHGINTPRGGGFSIMEDLQKDLHQESNDLAGVHPKTGSAKKAAGPDVGKIMRYEDGEMDQDEIVEFFQELIDSGAIYHLQGSYGRMAQHLISQGLCHRKGQVGSSKKATITRCPKCREILDEDDSEWMGEDQNGLGWSKMRESCPKCRYEKTYTMSENGNIRNVRVVNTGHLPMAASDKIASQKYRDYTIEKSGDNFYVKDPSGHRAFGEVPASIETAKKWIDQDIHEKGSKKASDKFAGLKSRRALYWCAPDRTYRLTQQEQQAGQANCPRCQIPMEKENFTRSDKLLICPQCRFKVPTSKAVNKVEIKVPAGVEVDVTTQAEGCDEVQDDVVMGNTRRGRFALRTDDATTMFDSLNKVDMANLPRMSIKDIAQMIADDWKNVNYAAKPYLSAMFSLNSISDMYMADTGTSVVGYFLANAGSYRGATAVAIKKELQRRIR